MLASSVIIRTARPQDAEDLAAVHEASWRAAYQGILPHLALERRITARSVRWWKRALSANRGVLILKIEGEPAGYASVGASLFSSQLPPTFTAFNAVAAAKDKKSDKNRTGKPGLSGPFKGEIFELYLAPEYQGLGFGSRFFDAARETLASRGLTPGLIVWALSENDRAVNFYHAKGGEVLGQVEECFGGLKVKKTGFVWS